MQRRVSRPVLVAVAGVATAGFGVFGIGITTWAVAHLAGGLVELDGDRVLYNAVLLPHLRYDNVVHFFGFGIAGVAAWEALAPRLAGRDVDPVAVGITVWLFGMGSAR